MKKSLRAAGIAIVFVVLAAGMLVGACLFFKTDWSASEKLHAKLDGQYDNYILEAYGNGNIVLVSALPKEPRLYIKALSEALDKVEKESGRKVTQISGVTYAMTFHLQQPCEEPAQ